MVSRVVARPCLWVLRRVPEAWLLALKPGKPRDAAVALHAVRRRGQEKVQSSIGFSKSGGAGPRAAERGPTDLRTAEP